MMSSLFVIISVKVKINNTLLIKKKVNPVIKKVTQFFTTCMCLKERYKYLKILKEILF